LELHRNGAVGTSDWLGADTQDKHIESLDYCISTHCQRGNRNAAASVSQCASMLAHKLPRQRNKIVRSSPANPATIKCAHPQPPKCAYVKAIHVITPPRIRLPLHSPIRSIG